MQPELPHSDAFVKLHLLDGGSMTGPQHMIMTNVDESIQRLYNWSFYIFHPVLKRHVLWDIGISSNKDDYSTFIATSAWPRLSPIAPKCTVEEQLRRRNGLEPEKIDTVLFSHAHFDHCRPIRSIFPSATGYFGPGTAEHCPPGHFDDPGSMFDGRFFDPERRTEKWETLKGPWVDFGPFKAAMDFFGDGSLWVCQAPGHMPGNLCAVVRVEGGDWVLLGSDCCHSRRIMDGLSDFAQVKMPDGTIHCLQDDLVAARETVACLRVMERKYRVHIALAHDTEWMQAGSDQVLMGLMDGKLQDEAKKRIRLGEALV
ncbi:beta-lactamase-like protein [Paraphoma chrysanthemicola]|nr:beta-lactamase-like protein [Paraphoma chrysanthemicola]